MKKSRSVITTLTILCLVMALFSATAEAGKKKAQKQAAIDASAKNNLARLFNERPGSKELFDQSYGYAVFNNTKVSLGLTGGGGAGVAVAKDSGARTYMKMAIVGVNVGLGAQKYQVIFLFQNADAFEAFVDLGWEAEASANAVAWRAGQNAGTTFRNGIAVFQLTEAGLMLQADISGTKYWKSKRLN